MIQTRYLPQLVILAAAALLFIAAPALSQETSDSPRQQQLENIKVIVDKAIQEGKIPGAVVIIGDHNGVVYKKAFGYRALLPEKELMTVDTIFDISSLTKVAATTIAVLQLVEQGKLRLEDPVYKYWPDFKANGKEAITVRQLLTHYSGLRPDLDNFPQWHGYNTALSMILKEKPGNIPGTNFVYSDINFIILGELVHRLSGAPLDVYCTDHIFKPLGMKDTAFNPSPSVYNRIAPTQFRKGKVMRGDVHDPMAYNMGGVAGHAGLFSTAEDLSIFAMAMLNMGAHNKVHILSPLMVAKMTSPQSPVNKTVLRGLGWDIDSPYSSNRGVLFPVGSYGHTGFTGTSLWIDPTSKMFVIVLTNHVHPDGKGDSLSLRAEISTIAAAAMGSAQAESVLTSGRTMTGYYELSNSYHTKGSRNATVKTGIDYLESEKFASLTGLKIGLITNQTGFDSKGSRTVDVLYNAPGVKLKAIFSPEHGFFGDVDEVIKQDSITDSKTGLPVYNLYGKTYRPTPEMLDGLDALVFDIQDVGVRYYTYITTMGYAMEAAAKKGIAFYVLDRPNPITGAAVQGPIREKGLKTFTNYFPLPVRYGMTIGELAGMFNSEYKIGVNLKVIKMQGYERSDWYDETGLMWANPSPNIRSVGQAVLYPASGIIESANISVGRGTDTPFEVVGAPWIDARQLAAYLNNRKINGVRFMPVEFRPTNDNYAGKTCYGVRIIVTERDSLNSPALGIELASALYNLYPVEFGLDKTVGLISDDVLVSIKNNIDARQIKMDLQEPLKRFMDMRSNYLLY
ncbi:exo-beta-N-acetylmuramidase NamZ domain-containing protein [Candidatus Magnetominusculus dajiuhuensis]|uniref:exo-beta-N-acetylmuramidase NamZ domain-containing protein n=1 Tax=Candidatus Magnetominusculus dajiuhuensis TaxID=3137712 RepID=UPI003B43C773